jgi:DNA polymerase-3 subunit beta
MTTATQMKMTIDRPAFADALAKCVRVVMARPRQPILACVRIEAADGKVTLSATNLEQSITIVSERVDITGEGVACVDAARLLGIIGKSIEPTMELEMDGDAMEIRGDDARFKLFGMPPADFPNLPEPSGASFEIGAKELAGMIGQVVWAVATDAGSHAMSGVLVERTGGDLALVATSGKVLVTSKAKVAKGDKVAAIVPPGALRNLLAMIGKTDGAVSITAEHGQMKFTLGEFAYSTALMEGSFPPYKDIIPKSHATTLVIDRESAVAAFDRAGMFANQASANDLKVSFAGDTAKIVGVAPELGECDVALNVSDMTGDAITIGVNQKHIANILSAAPGDNVELRMTTPIRPIVFASQDFLAVKMPVSLK